MLQGKEGGVREGKEGAAWSRLVSLRPLQSVPSRLLQGRTGLLQAGVWAVLGVEVTEGDIAPR